MMIGLLIIPVVFLLLVATIWWYATIPSNLPPGPLGLPFIGSTLDTWKVATWFRTLSQWSREYGPVYKLYIGNQLVVVLGDYHAIQEAMVKQGDAYAGRPVFHIIYPDELAGLGLANSEGELWKAQRRFALSTLRDLGIGRPILEPRIKDEAEYLLHAISANEGHPFDMSPLLANSVSNVICSLVFGQRFNYDDERFIHLLKLVRSRMHNSPFTFMTPVVLSETVAKWALYLPMMQRVKEKNYQMVRFIREGIKKTLGNFDPEQDEPMNYVQSFHKARHVGKDNSFSDQQLIASVINLFVGGLDTTSTTLQWAVFFMAHYPEIQEKVYQELLKENSDGHTLFSYADRTKLPFTEAVIMEIQRLANIIPVGLFRKTMVPTKLRGYDIPAGTVVAPLMGAVLADPLAYPNPDQFDPTRFLNAQKDDRVLAYLIPFSAGKRICLGESLAKMELFIFFTSLILRYRFFFSTEEPKPPLGAPNELIRGPVAHSVCAESRG